MSDDLPLLTEVGLRVEGVRRPWWGSTAVWCPTTEQVFALIDQRVVRGDLPGANTREVFALGGDPDDELGGAATLMVDGSFVLVWVAEALLLWVTDIERGVGVRTRVRGALDGAWLHDGALYCSSTEGDRRIATALDLRSGRERWAVEWAEQRRRSLDSSTGFVSSTHLVLNRFAQDAAVSIALDSVSLRATFPVVAASAMNAVVRVPSGGLALFSLSEQQVVALLEGSRRAARSVVVPWGEDRFLIEGGGQLLVLDANERAITAAARIEGGAVLDRGLFVGDRLLVEDEASALAVRPLRRDECALRVNSAVRPSARSSVVKLGRTRALPARAEDLERLRLIVSILDEEDSNLGAARDRLQARGVIPDGFDPRLRMQSSDGELSSFKWTDRSRRAWITAAYDAGAIVECEELAREAIERWRPWWHRDEPPSVQWWTGKTAPKVEHFDEPWQLLREVFFITRTAVGMLGSVSYSEWVERAELWAEASRLGLCVLGKSQTFRELPSPYEPLVAMFSSGVCPLSLSGESLLLGRALIEDERSGEREPCAWRR